MHLSAAVTQDMRETLLWLAGGSQPLLFPPKLLTLATPHPAAQMLCAVSGIGLGLVDAFLSTLVILMWPAGLSAQSTQNVHQTELVETSNVSTPVLDFVE
jgi:hypothetical protein